MDNIVIVGASLAGVRTAEALRAEGFTGQLVLINAEAGTPYDRPPLSKGFLEGKRKVDHLALRPSDPELHSLQVTMVHDAAVSLHVDDRVVTLASGDNVHYDGLVIASGTRARHLPSTGALPNPSLPRVHTLRTLTDATHLQERIVPGARVVVIGAGFIGAEVASTAHAAGAHVTVLEAAPVPLARQLGADMGMAIASLHERNGVDLRTAAVVTSISATEVELADGSVFPYDACVVGVGVAPNVEWLHSPADGGSSFDLTDGVRCDNTLRALVDNVPDPHIVAVGDIARWVNPRYEHEGPIRVEHWTNAAESAAHAASTLLGSAEPYAPVPYFWSDQYGSKIQFLGRSAGFDEVVVVTGTIDSKFVALYRRGDQLVGALGVSSIKTLMGFRQPLLDGCSWADALARVAD